MVAANLTILAVSEADLTEFLQFCGIVQALGEKGTSRKILVTVDGDGSGRFSFWVNDKRINSPDIDPENLPEVYLGE